MSEPLPHINDVPDNSYYPVSRVGPYRHQTVLDDEYVGPRGGRKVPVSVNWKNQGTGLFTRVLDDVEPTTTALLPYVKWHNGKPHSKKTQHGVFEVFKYRYTYLPKWMGMTGQAPDPIHYSHWAQQPSVEIRCGGSTTPLAGLRTGYSQMPADIHWGDRRRGLEDETPILYTFNQDLVTCIKCLEAEQEPKKNV